jgi:purine-nucleoside phosphorylase
MSVHIGAKPGDIADTVLISGDPLRAKHAAHTLLEDVTCYNEVRGMLGFTGKYKGKRVSIQGTGMGIPSTSIYVNELIDEYKVKSIIRVGTCGAIRKDINLGRVIIAISASTDSSTNRIHFNGMDYAATADFGLLTSAFAIATAMKMDPLAGTVFSTDTFYSHDKKRWDVWAEHGVIGVEMETSILYTIAARRNVKALSLLTVSDNIITEQFSSSMDREVKYMDMMKIALEISE